MLLGLVEIERASIFFGCAKTSVMVAVTPCFLIRSALSSVLVLMAITLIMTYENVLFKH